MNKRRNLGRFHIGIPMIEDFPEVVKDLTDRMIIIKAESLYAYDSIEYTAISDIFPEVSAGQIIPEYNLTCDIAGEVVAK